MGTSTEAAVAVRLQDEASRILRRWEERVRALVPAAAGQPSGTLLGGLPELLGDLAAALASTEPARRLRQLTAQLALEHGRGRANLEGYTADAVVQEYRVLRQVLFESLERTGPLPPALRDLLLDAVEASLENAVREFNRRHELDRHQKPQQLQELNAELERRVTARTSALKQSEELFRRLVEGVQDYAIFTVDPAGFVTSWNSGAERMKRYTPKEIIGVHFSIFYPKEGRQRDEPMAHLKAAALEGRFRGEGMRVRKGGEHFLADVLITPMYLDGQLAGFSKVVADLTELNTLIQERDLSRVDVARLQVEQELRESFVTAMTHDLRSPLSAARITAEQISRQPEPCAEVQRRAVKIMRLIDRTDQMIGDLLDAKRLGAGEGLALEMAPCDLGKLVREQRDLTPESRARVEVHIDGRTRGVWNCEELRRVVDNLVSNALKYGDERKKVTVHVWRVEDTVLLAVHNEGSLITPEEQATLFQRFRRTGADQARKRGWGLGLALVKGIVQAHGGMVKVESYPVEGTTFTVHLPVNSRAHRMAEPIPTEP